tara:strand:+ start:549 stop:839 length:291 start_codon:yes stop_codon:yes gene_type:complete
MFWFLYIATLFLFSYLISSFFKKKKLIVFFCCLIIFITPAQIEVGSPDYAPAIFTFFYNSTLAQDFSIRVLRPLFLSLPIGFLCLWLFFFIKRKLF